MRDDPTSQELQTERDRREIVDATIRYCWAIDGRDWADLDSVFTPEAVAEYGFVSPLQGLGKIREYTSAVLSPLDCSQHLVTNHQVSVDGEAATSRCYFHAQHTLRGLQEGENYVVAGVYRDTWTRTPAGWRSIGRWDRPSNRSSWTRWSRHSWNPPSRRIVAARSRES